MTELSQLRMEDTNTLKSIPECSLDCPLFSVDQWTGSSPTVLKMMSN
jgi:hypothetical protein